MHVVLNTSNERKPPEYRRFFARHGIQVRLEGGLSVSDEVCRELLDERGCLAVLGDSSFLYDGEGPVDTSSPEDLGECCNVCTVRARYLSDGELVSQTWTRSTTGRFRAASEEDEGWAWDRRFVALGARDSFAELGRMGLKVSSREQALSAMVRELAWFQTPRSTLWTDVRMGRATDFMQSPADVIPSNPILQRAMPEMRTRRLDRLLTHVLHTGTHFRAPRSKRERNYWWPGLNGGIPLTPKRDPVHEITFAIHDCMHHVHPDLVPNAWGESARRTYILWRMAGEAYSLVVADMLIVDCMRAADIEYDWSKRAIHPLYVRLVEHGLEPHEIFRNVATYCLTGNPSGLPSGPELDAFTIKYARFFASDYEWTARNWERMRADEAIIEWAANYAWHASSLGLLTLSRADQAIGSPASLDEHIEAVLAVLWARHTNLVEESNSWRGLLPVFQDRRDLSESRSLAFRRWLFGQLAAFPRYVGLLSTDDRRTAHRIRDELVQVVYRDATLDRAAIRNVRESWERFLRLLHDRSLLAADDFTTFTEVYPVFDPHFVYYDRRPDEAKSLAEVYAEVFP